MNEVITLFNGTLAEQIGWTLFHSLWQGLLIAGLAILMLRFVPGKFAHARYLISGTALLMIFLSAAGTFIYEFSATQAEAVQAQHLVFTFQPAAVAQSEITFFDAIQNFVVANKAIIVITWLVGALAFSIRLLGSWLYTIVLRSKATLLYNQWASRLHELRSQMGISKFVALAESSSIDAPVVIGFLKPIVIVPIGMFSGLTPEEVETILLHELMHIKRGDYLLNILQSVIETLLFFNPFVWMLSSIIRREREHCCDDGVVAHHGSPLAYAYALTRLEEIRMTGPSLALSVAGHRYELLDRIKRIMEKSAKKYSNAERIVPIVLLVAGVILASFLSIGKSPHKNENNLKLKAPDASNLKIIALDTPKNKKKGSASYYRKSETTYDKDGEPHEIVTEEYSGDENLFPMIDDGDFTAIIPDFDFPPMPDISMYEPAEIGVMPPMPFFEYNFDGDTTKYRKYWKEYNDEFRKNFKEQFNNFYKDHQKEFEAMMEKMESKFRYMDESRLQEHEEDLARMQEELFAQQKNLDKIQKEDLLREQEESLRKMEEARGLMDKNLRDMELKMKELEKNMAGYEKELTEQLIKDGYLKKGELETMQWNDNGDFLINSKKVKESDAKKYHELRQKFFNDSFPRTPRPGKPE